MKGNKEENGLVLKASRRELWFERRKKIALGGYEWQRCKETMDEQWRWEWTRESRKQKRRIAAMARWEEKREKARWRKSWREKRRGKGSNTSTSLVVHGVVIRQVGLGVSGDVPPHVPVHVGVPLITVSTKVVFLKVTLWQTHHRPLLRKSRTHTPPSTWTPYTVCLCCILFSGFCVYVFVSTLLLLF